MNQIDSTEAEARTPWIAPTVETMAAGDAEGGPSSNQEGQAGLS